MLELSSDYSFTSTVTNYGKIIPVIKFPIKFVTVFKGVFFFAEELIRGAQWAPADTYREIGLPAGYVLAISSNC